MPRDLHPAHQTLLFGVDFTSAPRSAKPITVAVARASVSSLALESLLRFESLPDWQHWLGTPGPWVGGFDFPFGLPRGFVDALGWARPGIRQNEQLFSADRPDPESESESGPWAAVTRHLARLSRAELVAACRSWCDARPPGDKFAHRQTDRIAGSSPSMKWVNPPVVLMLQVGAPALLQAGVSLPGLHTGPTDPARIALEAYPGQTARALVGRASYKSDDPKYRRCEQRREARHHIITALQAGRAPFSAPVDLGRWAQPCLDDPGADLLDAVLCLTQTHRAWQARTRGWGLPSNVDPIEGWIIAQ